MILARPDKRQENNLHFPLSLTILVSLYGTMVLGLSFLLLRWFLVPLEWQGANIQLTSSCVIVSWLASIWQQYRATSPPEEPRWISPPWKPVTWAPKCWPCCINKLLDYFHSVSSSLLGFCVVLTTYYRHMATFNVSTFIIIMSTVQRKHTNCTQRDVHRLSGSTKQY